jgi:hypothetical protein
MLAHFQQALADLVAHPDRCQTIRAGGDLAAVFEGYVLAPRELARLRAIACHRGMEANCTVYRSNRMTPVVLNLPDTCAALGSHLRDVLDRFWHDHPTEHFVHFLIESERFARFVERLDPCSLPAGVAVRVDAAVRREGAVVRARLAKVVAEASPDAP